MAARKNKLELSDDWKERIRAGVLMDRLVKCVEGTLEMTPVQIKAADILLKKIVPDLARTDTKVEHSGTIGLSNILKDIDGRSADLPED